jgi:uncharacterized protein YbaP (TraB family)
VKRAFRLAAGLAGILFVVAALDALAAPQVAPRSAYDRGRLFRIDRPGIPASYVYGTLHSNDPRVVSLPPEVVAALAASRSVAFETLLLEGDVATFLSFAQYDDGRRLTDHVDAATLARIRVALGAGDPGPEVLERAKPWAVLLMLAQARDSGTASLDGVLQAEARARRLAVFGLELPDEQVAALDAIPLVSQLALMRWALDTQHARQAELEATTTAWLAGDLAGLRRLALEPGRRDAELGAHLQALMKHLITDRNLLLAHRLHLPLARGRMFVAVGALHLQGRDGLLALIRRQGYRVTRVL